ncbi:MAG: hypothetical protein J7K04_09560 [Spirochaetales bacterium]|nr:hypothetical protein [Spirochaetales bacterium]
MKKLLKFTGFFLLFFAFQYVSAAPQQIYSPLHDPHIQSGENLSYLVVNKKSSVTIKETVELDKSGRKYLIRVTTPLIYRELALLRETMTPVELTIVTKNDSYLLTTRKSIKYSGKNQNTSKTGKLALLSASDMPYSLRGYPFEKPVPVEIIFLNDQGAGDDDTPFKVTAEASGEESISAAGRSIPCYVLEIKYHISGFMSLFKSMFPKTTLWYSKESPHYLVKYENKGSRGSTGNMVMKLTQYSGWKRQPE